MYYFKNIVISYLCHNIYPTPKKERKLKEYSHVCVKEYFNLQRIKRNFKIRLTKEDWQHDRDKNGNMNNKVEFYLTEYNYRSNFKKYNVGEGILN